MRKTEHGETICLAWWEIDLIFRHIDELKDQYADLKEKLIETMKGE